MKVRSAIIELIAFLLDRNCDSRALRLRHHRRELAHRMVDTQPQFPRMKISHHRRHSPVVVGMRMRDHHHVKMIDPPIPKIRRHHLFAQIEVGMHPRRQSSRIDEQSVLVRRHQQNGIALTHVNGSHLHHPRREYADAKVQTRSTLQRQTPEPPMRKRPAACAESAPPPSPAPA